MKKYITITLTICSGAILFVFISAFLVCDPKPDFSLKELDQFQEIVIDDIQTENKATGNFKTAVTFNQPNSNTAHKVFFGQEIKLNGNPNIDRILIGVTNNLISRVEIWNNDLLVETKELGFVGKMTWGENQEMTVDFYDQTNAKYKGESKISMRFYSGSGFLGDIGTIGLNLTKYGDVSGEKKLTVFTKLLESGQVTPPAFSNLRVWKNFASFD